MDDSQLAQVFIYLYFITNVVLLIFLDINEKKQQQNIVKKPNKNW